MTAIHRCKRCLAPVKWITTTREKSQALEPLPRKDGTVAIVASLGVTLTKEQRESHDGDLYMPHDAVCGNPRRATKAPPTGLTAITGLSFVGEADRLARALMKAATHITKRALPDERDCEVAFRYFRAQNPGIDPKVIPLLRPRIRQIVAERSQEARA